jgi:hypothetical protein
MKAGRALSLMTLALAVNCGHSKRTSSGDTPSSSGGVAAAGGSGGTARAGGAGTDVGGSSQGGAAGGGNEAGDAGEGEGGVSTGGASTGGTPMGGMGGGNAGASGCLSPATLFPAVVPTGQTSGLDGNANPPGAPARSFDGYVIQTPCVPTACENCVGSGWRYEGLDTGCGTSFEAVQNFTVGGTPGQSYRVTLHFYGIVEPKRYGPTVTRESATRPANLDTGATPPPWAYADGSPSLMASDFGTYEIHVVDNDGVDVCSYFLNSDTSEGNWTYVLNYERTINVIGGGRVRVRRFDRDCEIIKNCSLGGTTAPCTPVGCNNRARVVDISAAMPQPTGLLQPGLMNDDAHSGQWLLIDVTSVQCGLPALDCNGT